MRGGKPLRVTMSGRAAMFATAVFFALPVMTAVEGVSLDVAGVTVPEMVTLEGTGEKLVLQGVGVRKKLFIKIYVGALYLRAKTGGPDRILDAPGGKRVTMTFLHKEIEGAKLVSAWEEGFKANLTAQEQEDQAKNIVRFNGFFSTVRKGDQYTLDHLPGSRTVVSLNSREVGTIPGDAFFRALLKVWIGPRPADKGLRKAWLGG